MTIQPLKDTQSSDTKRVYLDALIQLIPSVGGSISALMAHHWPYAGEEEIRKKVNEITDMLNQLEAAINKTGFTSDLPPRLSVLAVLIARFLCENTDDYLTGSFDTQPIFEAFSGIKKTEIEDAFVELIKQGFLIESAVLAYRYKYVVCQPQLFFVFYPDVYGWLPAADALCAGELMVENKEFGKAAKLDAHLGWPRKRLNAALLFLKTVVFDERHYSKSLQADYQSTWFSPEADERYELRNLRQRLTNVLAAESNQTTDSAA